MEMEYNNIREHFHIQIYVSAKVFHDYTDSLKS